VQAITRVEKVAVSIKDSLNEWSALTQKKVESVEMTAREAQQAAEASIASSRDAVARAEAIRGMVRNAADEAVLAAQEAAEAARSAAREISDIMAGDSKATSRPVPRPGLNPKRVPAPRPEPAPEPQLTPEEKAQAQAFEQSIGGMDEPGTADKQLAMQAKKRMQERMNKLAMMYRSAGETPATEPVDDDHIIEDKED